MAQNMKKQLPILTSVSSGNEPKKISPISTGNEGQDVRVLTPKDATITQEKSVGSDSTNHDTSVLGDTSVLSVLSVLGKPNTPNTPRTCINDYIIVFSDTIVDKILKHFLTNKNKPISVAELAKKIGENKGSVRGAINRHKAYFSDTGVKGLPGVIQVIQVGMDYVQCKIDIIKAQEDEKKEKEERISQRIELETSSQEVVILEFKNFLRNNKKILQNTQIYHATHVLIIDYNELLSHSPKLADYILNSPEKAIRLFETSIEEGGLLPHCRVRIKNLPNFTNVLIEDARSHHLDNFISVRGKIIQSSDSRPQTVNAKFECPSCGTIISVIQMDKEFREPKRCSCGRRGGFKLLVKEMVDSARFILQDLHELAESSNTKRLNCFVKEDLASSKVLNRLLQAGNEVIVNGVLKDVPVPLAKGGLSTRSEIALEVNFVELSEEEVNLDKLTDEEKEEFEELAHRIDEKGLDEITPSFAPVVQGHNFIKQALALYPCNRLNRPGVDEERNKSNLILIGDPSTAKSVLARFLMDVCIGGKKVVGGSTSAVGITGAATKDEFLGGWMINPGALVLAKGVLFIEELNTMDDEDKAKIQDAMESQYIDITKANTSARFKVRTGIITCANPIDGHFSPAGSKKEILKQFNIPSPILSRFDVVFLFRDIPDVRKDFEISRNMKRRKNKLLKPEFEQGFLKKFFCYIQNQPEPTMDDEFEILSAKIYATIRKINPDEKSIGARVSEAIDRMCIASAKIRCSDKVEEKDLERVINILANSFFAIPEYDLLKLNLKYVEDDLTDVQVQLEGEN